MIQLVKTSTQIGLYVDGELAATFDSKFDSDDYVLEQARSRAGDPEAEFEFVEAKTLPKKAPKAESAAG